jgi:hypothetical protein
MKSGQPQGADPTSGEGHVPDLRAAAAELDAAGLNVIPIKADGTKMPDLPRWKQYQTERTTPAQHNKWFAPDRYDGAHTGIGYICGAVSGNVGMVEFEGRAIADGLLDEAAELMVAHGLSELWERLTTGYTRTSPSGGVHIDFRIVDGSVPRGTKIAQRAARDDELTADERDRLKKNPKAKVVRCLVETRGEGNLVVVDPSHGAVHRTGRPYQRRTGSPATIAEITADEYEALVAILGLLDQTPRPEYVQPGRKPAPRRDGGKRPGDDFNERADWRDILAGIARPLMTHGHTTYWGWADGVGGVKATTGRDPDVDRVYFFATGSDFDAEKAYTKFGAYTLLQHGGDWKAAAQELRRRGYGDPLPHEKLATVTQLHPRSSTTATDGSSALKDAPAPTVERLEDGRPKLDIGVEADAIDAINALMANGQLADLYTRTEGPVWISEDNDGYPEMHHLGADNFRAYMAEQVLTFTVVKDDETDGTKEVRTLLHPRTCSTILGQKSWPLPKLKGLVTSPVVRPDGSLLLAPGYDTATGLYLHPRVPLRRLSSEIAASSVQAAKDIVVNQMLADFPWVDDSDKAHFLGALLTPILRPYFHGPTPMWIITSTAMASGKSLLKDILDHCYGLSNTPWPENEAELRKSITTQLYTAGQPVIVFDNLPNGYVIKSPTLSNLLTANSWGDRILGAMSRVSMPNDRVWIFTGNGLTTGGDNARRALWTRLDPNCPDPDQRGDFKVGDLRPWLRQNASTVVAALVTMVRSWLAAGGPTRKVRMGDYSEWASMMAGLLDHLEVPGWMSDRSVAAGMDTEMEEWTLLLEAWWAKFGTNTVTVGQALQALADQIPDVKGKPPTAQQFGHWLKARMGRYYGLYKIVQSTDAHLKQKVWRVETYKANSQGVS